MLSPHASFFKHHYPINLKQFFQYTDVKYEASICDVIIDKNKSGIYTITDQFIVHRISGSGSDIKTELEKLESQFIDQIEAKIRYGLSNRPSLSKAKIDDLLDHKDQTHETTEIQRRYSKQDMEEVFSQYHVHYESNVCDLKIERDQYGVYTITDRFILHRISGTKDDIKKAL